MWLMNYDSVARTATICYTAANTGDSTYLYCGNPSATPVSNFSAVYNHGTGFDSGWGDLSTSTTGGGTVSVLASSTGPIDPRLRDIWVRSNTPTIPGTQNPGNTLVREMSIVTDPYGNVVTDSSGNWVAYYANMNLSDPSASYTTYRCQSSDQGLTWTNHTLVLGAGRRAATTTSGQGTPA